MTTPRTVRPSRADTRPVPPVRIRLANDAPVRPARACVLYWMVAARRARANFALQRAVELAVELGRPLIVFEPLRVGYPWASDRLHAFVLQGMVDNVRAFARTPARYFPYVEARPGEGRGLLEALAANAAAVVTDDAPVSFLPRMIAAAAGRLDVRLEAVDGNGLHPLRAVDRVFTTAFSYRAHLQKTLRRHLDDVPLTNPLAGVRLPPAPGLDEVLGRWPEAPPALLTGTASALAGLPIDHDVAPVAARGGSKAGHARLKAFLGRDLATYADDRHDPDDPRTSGLSAYLHFGHVSAHEVFDAVMTHEGWTRRQLAASGGGRREGWWGVTRGAEAFLDQLVTWREIGFNAAAHLAGHDRYDTLPAWARTTLAAHARDPRPHRYDRDTFERAATHDPLWNAAQRELVRDGRIHTYLRMLWGKKILEWSRTPQDALDTMIQLNDKYALDGRDPNSCSGIFWCLGRYDRPWGPERDIFGTVRYMSSENTARKLRLKGYLARYGPSARP
ncbi:MAG: deoxyribodipyrimidine photolyase [Vicinamibacteria bacterium]